MASFLLQDEASTSATSLTDYHIIIRLQYQDGRPSVHSLLAITILKSKEHAAGLPQLHLWSICDQNRFILHNCLGARGLSGFFNEVL